MKKKVTAGELLASLNSDPAYVARKRLEEERHRRRSTELGEAELPLREDLERAGYAVGSVWDLVNSPGPYSEALPILLAHLRRSYPAPVREGIARALAIPAARFAWSDLVEAFSSEKEKRAKDALAAALAAMADSEQLDELAKLARDPANGPSRVLLLSALARGQSPKLDVLEDLADDPELAKEVRVLIRRVRRSRAQGQPSK